MKMVASVNRGDGRGGDEVEMLAAVVVPRWRRCAADDGCGDDVDVVMMLVDGGDDVGGWCTGSSGSVGMRCGGGDDHGGCDEM
ncbi:hypothetical protein Tco_1143420 [Tanacetum coccineum]